MGKVYYFGPLAGWSSYKIKVLAAYDSTLVDIYCNNTANSYNINAGRFLDTMVRNFVNSSKSGSVSCSIQ